MKEQSSFGTLLKRYRLAAGLSQEALAARASLSARTISDLERGVHGTPHSDTLELLTGALPLLSAHQRTLLLAAARPQDTASTDFAPLSPSYNLPFPPARLIGREQERSHIRPLLCRTDTHLLTLTGPSGVGKTRLALQLAQDLAPDFVDGVVFVTLAPIRDAALVHTVVAQAFGIREVASSSLIEQVHRFLREKHLLLVLDNFEQVLDAASFVADLLATCPRLSVLVTSRIPLHLRSEQAQPLASLPLEDAVTLFQERAHAIDPSRAYAAREVAAICEQVDCLPLAIELAAMHVRVLSLSELRKRLTHRLALLRNGPADLPTRQQTMEGAIAWSYELLTEEQQRCFRALSVFVGGWTLEAAEAVCQNEGEVAEEEIILTMAALVDASLVQAEISSGDAVRFNMLELIREYALQQLQAAGEEQQYRSRHATWYARLAESIFAYFGPEQGVRDTQFTSTQEQELPNARAALQWAEEKHEAELGLRLVGFARLWHIRGQMSEAENWFERMLTLDRRMREQGEQAAPLPMRIEKLYGLARTLVRHGRLEHGAEEFAREALQLAQHIGDLNGISNAYATLGMIAQALGRLDEAEVAFTESYTHARSIEHRGLISRALFSLADLARMRGDVARATVLLEEGLASAKAFGITWDIPIAMTLLGHLAREQQHYALAKVRYREALTLYRAFSSPTYIASCLESFAATVCAEEHYAQTTRLYAAADALRKQTQTPLSPAEREEFEQTIATAKAALGEPAFVKEWNTGAALTQDAAIEDALSHSNS